MGVPSWLEAISGGLLSALKREQLPDPGTPRRIADQFAHWATHLTKSAISVWTPYVLRGETCSFCREDAIGGCIGCNDPCCLAHSHISYRGELICDECVGNKVLNKQAKKQSKVDRAFEYLNLTSGATLEEITAVYRIRSKQTHPDRGGHTDEMKKLNEHFEVLKAHLARRAA